MPSCTSNRPQQRQVAIDYLKREITFAAAVNGVYLLVVPGAVGRPRPYDDSEFERSVETLRLVAPLFTEYHVKATIEPIRSAEVSFIHTVADAVRYIQAVNHLGVQHINGDVYHMQSEETHVAEAVLTAGDRLTNLHIADSNRCALGEGSLDLDTLIMAFYLIGYNQEGRFVTPEPLGPGGDPYPVMNGRPPCVISGSPGSANRTLFPRTRTSSIGIASKTCRQNGKDRDAEQGNPWCYSRYRALSTDCD